MIGWRSGNTPIGLDVGSRFIKAAQLTAGAGAGGRIVALACIERPTPGADLSPREAGTLRAVLDRQGFIGRRVVVGAPTAKLLTAVMELPPRSSGAPLDRIAAAEFGRAHGCAPEGMQMAWWDLPAGTRAVEGTHVFAVGLRHADAETILDALGAAGLDAAALDSGVLGLARACTAVRLAAEQEASAQVVGLLDIGWTATTLAVLHAGTLVYQRTLPERGMAALRARLVEAMKIEPEVAELVLRRVGLTGQLGPEQEGLELLDDARSLVAEHADALGTELKASLSYATRRHGAAGSAGVFGAGGGACVPGLIERVAREAEVSVRSLSPSDLAEPGSDPILAALAADPRLAAAAGLALTATVAAAKGEAA